MKSETEDRQSLILLFALLFFLVLSAFAKDDWISEVVGALSLYAVLIITILKVAKPGRTPWAAILLGICSLAVTVSCVFRPIYGLLVANWLLLSVFFGYASVALFAFLGRGAIMRAKLVACFGLYLIVGMFYYAVFNLIQVIHPGSFMEIGPPTVEASRHSLLYLSLVTLTTVGYGDVVPVSRPARMFAVLEGMSGLFYMAVTVARLVAAYQQEKQERE